MRFLHRLVLALFVLSLLLQPWATPWVAAQEATWDRPINLSLSGAASAPQLLRGEGDALYAYWWDAFDGVTVSSANVEGWSAPEPVPLTDISFDEEGQPKVDDETGAIIRETIRTPGTLASDNAGRVNVFFLGVTSARQRPLRQASAAIGSGSWSEPRTIVASASAWCSVTSPDGAIHLAVMVPGRVGERRPGLYYMRSDDGGATWGSLVLVSESLYVRMATQADTHMQLVPAGDGRLFLTWDEPSTMRALYSWSWDGGETWARPTLVDASDRTASRAQIVLAGGGTALMVWQGATTNGEQALMMRRSEDGGWNWTGPEQVLSGLRATGAQVSLQTLPDGNVLLVAGGQAEGPVLAAWRPTATDGSTPGGWSNLMTLSYPLRDLEARTAMEVPRWQPVIQGGRLLLIGADEQADVWLLGVPLAGLSWTFPERSSWLVQEASPAEGWGEPFQLAEAGVVVAQAQPAPAPLEIMPQIIAGQNGQLQAFWWHAFDGLTSAWFNGRAWLEPQRASAFLSAAQQAWIPAPGATFLGDGASRVHAFWLEEAAEAGGRALRHSSLRMGGHTWGEPSTLATVAAWRTIAGNDGALYLFYEQPGVGETPPGLYVQRLVPDQGAWSEPVLLRAFAPGTPLTEEGAHLALAADGAKVYAAWDDPEAGELLWAQSDDAGRTWSTPASLGEAALGLRWPHMAPLSGDALLLCYATQGETAGQLYQVELGSVGQEASAPVSVLPELLASLPTIPRLRLSVSDDQTLLLLAGLGSDTLTLATWSRQRTLDPQEDGWSAPQSFGFGPNGPMSGVPDAWSGLQAVLANGRLTVLGVGEQGDLWAISRMAQGEAWLQQDAPTWSRPEQFAEVRPNDDALALASDGQGRMHVLWSVSESDDAPGNALWYARYAEEGWTQPNAVIQPTEGLAEDPSLAVVADRLHAVWSGGAGGRIEYASTFAADAQTASSWPEPVWLPLPTSEEGELVTSRPQICADLAGRLHVVYAVPINQARGIYYTRSDDGGASWTPVRAAFDATAAGWSMVDAPAVAVAQDGSLYVAWLRMGYLGASRPQALYLARSSDGGVTWSEPKLVAEGNLLPPRLLAIGSDEVHIIWQEASAGYGVWHSYTRDRGAAWSVPMRVRGFSQLNGRVDAATDGVDVVYLVAPQTNVEGRAQLFQAIWESAGEQWVIQEPHLLPRAIPTASDVWLALEPLLGHLEVVLRSEAVDPEGQEPQPILVHLRRQVAPLEALPTPPPALVSQPAPQASSTPEPAATARPTVNVQAPPPGESAVEVGTFTVPVLAIGGLLAAALLVVGVLIARGARRP